MSRLLDDLPRQRDPELRGAQGRAEATGDRWAQAKDLEPV